MSVSAYCGGLRANCELLFDLASSLNLCGGEFINIQPLSFFPNVYKRNLDQSNSELNCMTNLPLQMSEVALIQGVPCCHLVIQK